MVLCGREYRRDQFFRLCARKDKPDRQGTDPEPSARCPRVLSEKLSATRQQDRRGRQKQESNHPPERNRAPARPGAAG